MLTNPFVLYSITWCVVIALYFLPWSDLLPPLSLELALFFIITSTISLLIGSLLHISSYFRYQKLKVDKKKVKGARNALILIYGLLCIEFTVFKGVPFISYVFFGADSQTYKNFGIPILHVFLVNGIAFLFLYSGHLLLSCDNKKHKLKISLYMVLCIIAGILIFNRGLVMYSLFGYSLIYLMSRRRIVGIILKISIVFLLLLYLFGLMGSYRNASGIEHGRAYIMEITEATEDFEETNIPPEYLWAYIYITSPLGNLQNTINKVSKENIKFSKFPEYLMELIPQMIEKRINLKSTLGERIVPYLTVGTIYMNSYATLGWLGMSITYLWVNVFVFAVILLIPRSSVYFISSITVVNIVVFFNMFDNMIYFMGIAPMLTFPVLFTLWGRLKKIWLIREVPLR